MPARKFFLCTIEGCSRPHAGRGYCKFHWKQWKKYGDPLWKSIKKEIPICKIQGCQNKGTKLGMCDAHYHRVRKHGDPNIVKKVKSYHGAKCSVGNCERQASHKGMCRLHWDYMRKNGTTERIIKSRPIKKGRHRSVRINGKKLAKHIHVWQTHYGPVPKGFIIHHIDGNHLNNNIGNLKLLTPSEHSKLHHPRGWTDDGKICKLCLQFLSLGEFNFNPRGNPDSMCKRCRNWGKNKSCLNCGVSVSNTATYCRSCAGRIVFRKSIAVPYRTDTEGLCIDCGMMKPLDNFIRSPAAREKTGEISGRCHECYNAYRRMAWNRKEHKCQDCGKPNSPTALWCRPCEARRWIIRAREKKLSPTNHL